MGICSAVNCSNSRKKGFRLFLFPRDTKRRNIWLQNCRRDNWQPKYHSAVCEIHFEEKQYEQNRLDGLKKLKPNAVPTIFDVPNSPRLLETNRKSLYETIGNCSSVYLTENRLSQAKEELEQTRAEIKRLKDENDLMKIEIQQIDKIEEEKKLAQLEVERLKTEVKKSNELLNTFFCDDHIVALNKPPRKWADKYNISYFELHNI